MGVKTVNGPQPEKEARRKIAVAIMMSSNTAFLGLIFNTDIVCGFV
jgi:hypothetical protein